MINLLLFTFSAHAIHHATIIFLYLKDAGEFDRTVPPNRTVNVIVGQANFIKCPKHEPGSNVIYKWGKYSEVSGTRFLDIKPNFIVLDDGTLFYSHITKENADQFNKYGWTCGMEAKVGDKNQFRWAEHIHTTLKIVKSKYVY